MESLRALNNGPIPSTFSPFRKSKFRPENADRENPLRRSRKKVMQFENYLDELEKSIDQHQLQTHSNSSSFDFHDDVYAFQTHGGTMPEKWGAATSISGRNLGKENVDVHQANAPKPTASPTTPALPAELLTEKSDDLSASGPFPVFSASVVVSPIKQNQGKTTASRKAAAETGTERDTVVDVDTHKSPSPSLSPSKPRRSHSPASLPSSSIMPTTKHQDKTSGMDSSLYAQLTPTVPTTPSSLVMPSSSSSLSLPANQSPAPAMPRKIRDNNSPASLIPSTATATATATAYAYTSNSRHLPTSSAVKRRGNIGSNVGSSSNGTSSNNYSYNGGGDDDLSSGRAGGWQTHHMNIKSKLLSLREKLNAAERTVDQQASEIDALQRKKKESVQKATERYQSELHTQKQQFESMIHRQQQFIDRLVIDKDEMNRKIMDLNEQILQVEERWVARVNDEKKKYNKQLQKHKANWQATENQRRQQWIQEKSKSIKAMTIKGIEPEIQRLIGQHKKDLALNENKHKEKIRQKENDFERVCLTRLEEQRNCMLRERDSVIEQERDMAAARIKKQIDRYDEQLNTQRLSLTEENEKQRQKLLQEKDHEVSKMRALVDKLQAHDHERLKDLKHQHNISLIDQQKRHSVHLRQLEEKHNIEKAAWQHNMMMQLREKLHQEFVIKETHLKNQMEKEKEAEINMVLNKLADENAEEQRRIRIRYNERVVQEQLKHQLRLDEAKARETMWMKKHDEVHDENRGKNAELSSLHEVQAEVRALKMELSEKALREEKMEAKLKAAKEEVERLEQSFTEKRTRDLEAKQQMIGLLEDRLSTEKRERKRMGELHSEQLSAMEEKYDAEKAAELEAFEARVRSMMTKKESCILSLQEALGESHTRIREMDQAYANMVDE